jgi:exopolyphosphatase/guanosine-5'-triphosphate,3'-diphosphate pyrophosphatase
VRRLRVAGIDCGTNSIRLLIADAGGAAGGDGTLTDVVREMQVVRLGQGVDRTGRLASEAIERTRVALAEYASLIKQHGAEAVRMVATSATRDAANRDEFVAMVRATLGTDPEVITGDEEAALSFAGAVGTLPDLAGPILLADIGGGSTELVSGRADGTGELRARSTDIGCVRMTERHLHDDPPTAAQVEAVVADVRKAVEAATATVPIRDANVLVGVAGTVTTIAALALDLRAYDPDAIHGSRISAARVAEITGRLVHMTRAERAALPVMHPGRVDVIGGGALILRTLVELSGVDEVIASEHDILDGIALSAAAARGRG